VLLQESERRSNQANDTPFLAQANDIPFLEPPLYNLIGPLGIGPHANAVLGGPFVAPARTDPYAGKLIDQLK
jgi:hypothetical protein